ncbi:hypothetical protein ETAE_2494 [Edwardsiella piscicida]|uniref:Uncharacterized protein n=1 Tax=Edwardsiella piscicida TaxID=1263550 RepID=A0AAU8P601_EDWPI|nr:hypothetical protein ETAE_2494 [Edwardsiella tarda EIB202]
MRATPRINRLSNTLMTLKKPRQGAGKRRAAVIFRRHHNLRARRHHLVFLLKIDIIFDIPPTGSPDERL